ncbi:MAG TPA: holo-ACP synthase [Gemmatimonadales bacterium]|jgi:holo-[acyl-carrier protein] synthase|nr:holo-ACP synthase [Gemmatimonadales bacterium]
MAVLGLGIDLVEVSDAQRLLDRWGERLLRRVLTEAERAYVLRFPRPAKHLAVRLAAKEAVYKALQGLPGSREIGWRDIEVERSTEGRPSIRLNGDAVAIARSAGVRQISLSLSHTQNTAGAVALVEGE